VGVAGEVERGGELTGFVSPEAKEKKHYAISQPTKREGGGGGGLKRTWKEAFSDDRAHKRKKGTRKSTKDKFKGTRNKGKSPEPKSRIKGTGQKKPVVIFLKIKEN